MKCRPVYEFFRESVIRLGRFTKPIFLAMVFLLGSFSSAQDQSQSEGQSSSELEDSNTQHSDDESVEEIVITGSRLRRTNIYSQVPIVSMDAKDISLSGETDLTALFQEIPALFSSTNSEQSSENDFSPGLGLLNLHGLGSKRTLVLVDGRRHIGGMAGNTAVDITTIPSALVERVEVVTGGASAVYGADAVSGVVNFILKKQFEGLVTEGQFGLSSQGDAAQTFLNVVGGSNFSGGKGNATFSVQYRNQNSIKYGDRTWSKNNGIANAGDEWKNPDQFYQSGPNIGQRIDNLPDDMPTIAIRKDPTWGITSVHGRIAVDLNGDGDPDVPGETSFSIDVNNNGINDHGETVLGSIPVGWQNYGDWIYDGNELRLFREGVIAQEGGINQFGGDGTGVTFNWADMFPQTEDVVASGSVRYELHPNINFFATSKFAHGTAQISGTVNSFNDHLTISLNNPFMPTAFRTALQDFKDENPDPEYANPQLLVTRDMTDMGISGSWVERSTFRTVTGFEGALNNGWRYEVSVNFGRASQRTTSRNRRVQDRFFAAIDAVDHPVTGETVCRSDLVPLHDEIEAKAAAGEPFDADLLARLRELDPATPPPTSPYPYFRKAFLTFEPGDGQCKPMNIFGRGAPSQESIDFVTTDSIRNDVIEQQVAMATLTGDTGDFLALPGGPIAFAVGGEYRREASSVIVSGLEKSKLLFGSGTQPLRGSYEVREAFAELSMPLLSDLFLIDLLTIEGAVRIADYTTAGSTTAWQARGSWVPIEDIRFRASYSRAIRAPNVYELFQPLTLGFFRPDDPCTELLIDKGPNPENRNKNCVLAGVPEGFSDPNTGRFEGLEGGNPMLKEEIADSITVGGVFTPTFLPGFSLALDYWDIEIEHAIEFLKAQDIVDGCYDASSLDNQLCRAIGRDEDTHGLNYIERLMMNIAAKRVRGIDVGFAYTFRLMDLLKVDLGRLDTSASISHLIKREDIHIEEVGIVDPETGEMTFPKWAGTVGLRWLYNQFILNYQLRWIGNQYLAAVEIDGKGGENLYTPKEAGSTFVHDIQVRYQILDNSDIYAGVNNLLDRKPFINRASYPVSAIGRFFYLGVTSSFN